MTSDKGGPLVLIIGDSISIGYTPTVRALLADQAEVRRIPENGGSTLTGLENIDEWLGESRWSVIHFNWGLHDLKYWRNGHLDMAGEQVCPPDEYAKNLDQLVTRLEQTGAKLIWATTTPVPEGAAGRIPGQETEYNRIAAGVMETHNTSVNDLHAAVAARLDRCQEPHNVHFKQEGYEVLGRKVAEAIGNALGDCLSA